MTVSTDELKLVLLDMVASARSADRHMMARLGKPEWRALGSMARQHRLEPHLHHRMQGMGADWPVPAALREQWARSYRKSAFRALSIEQTIGRIAARLDEARIPYAALKGAWLAWHAYEHPALRPLRDIDIIVPPGLAICAFDTLLAAGFGLRNLQEPSLEFALAHGKHLPGLVLNGTSISVEIHHRLVSPSADRDPGVLGAAEVLARRIPAGPAQGCICHLSPTDALLHLIVHAVYEHRFCNGPLVLTDIVGLLRAAEVDWSRLWRMAEQGGWADGCRLTLSLVEVYHGDCGVIWLKNMIRPTDAILKEAALMILQDHDQRGQVDLLSGFAARSWPGKIKLAARRAWPARHALAAFAGLPTQSRGLWLYYPGWLLSRIVSTTRNLLTAGLRAEIQRARLVRTWLRS